MIKPVVIDEIDCESDVWLIDGFVSPWLTVVSGQPKHGKSLLAGHIALSLINETPLLGREVSGNNHRIGWMGYDPGWKTELKQRWSANADQRIFAYDPIRSLNPETWLELANSLVEEGVTLFVIDHLYGMAGVLGLNDAENFAKLSNLIRPIYDEFKIPVLLLTQAGRNEFGRGRAAHSVAIEGEARALVRIYEKRSKGSRKIDLSSNTRGEETLLVTLTNEVIEVRDKKNKSEETNSRRESPDIVRSFLAKANPDEMINWSGAGRELSRLEYSKNPNAGREMAKRWRNQNLLKFEEGRIIAGDSLLPEELINNYQDINVA